MASSTPRFGWIGLGSMGIGMAKNLQKHLTSISGPALHYTNRTLSRGEPLQALGGIPCPSVAEVVEKSDIIFSSISTDDVLEQIVSDMLALGDSIKGKILVDTSTVHPDTSSGVAAKLEEAGAEFVGAPVFGASPAAEAGTLLFAISGSPHAVQKITPFVQGVLARHIIHVGEGASRAVLLKTSSNFLMAGLMELIGEAHVFAEKTGLGSEVLETLLQELFGTLAYSDSRRMTQGIYAPGKGESAWSDVSLAIKDVQHGLTSASRAGISLPIGELAMSHLQKAKKYAEENRQDMPSLDSTSIYGAVRLEAGLDFENDLVKKRDAEAK